MPPVHLLIKPASSHCNMRCAYCFYSDISHNRSQADYGLMTLDSLEIIVQKTFAYAEGHCTFAFQGGEPTLAGLDFFKKLIEFEKRYNTKRIQVNNVMQTNGYIINDEWAAFLGAHKFLIGLSLDGVKEIHDRLRADAGGDGTFKTVMRAAAVLDKYKVDYNTLTVVTAQVAKSIGKIYGFYKRNRFLYQQYIPCIEPIGAAKSEHSLTPELYAQFLKTLFDLWYNDIKRGVFVYIRYFENLAGMLAGHPPEHCGMLGHCTRQIVIEADGSVFPCDFYATDSYKIGNILTDSFDELEAARQKSGFIEASLAVSEQCLSCQWKNICRGGCRRDRDYGDAIGHNYYCEAYREFFDYAVDRVALLIRK